MNRKRTLSFDECILESRLSLSVLSHSAIIAPTPIYVVIPVGTGSIRFPTLINDPGNYPGPDGHMMPGIEEDPGPPAPEASNLPIVSHLGINALIV